MKMKRLIAILLIALFAVPAGIASNVRDDNDKDSVVQRGIRRLYPDRLRAKAIKKLREQMSRKAEPKADPWDTSDEVWGTVDFVPVTVKDISAVEGHRLSPLHPTTKTPDEQAALDEILSTDYSLKEYGVGLRRMTWRDEPVTLTREQLMPYLVIEEGECFSKYVSREKTSNEAFFIFSIEDSIPGPLRLCVQYCADDPLEYDMLTFTVDGFDYIFYPNMPNRGTIGEDLYWEMSDDELQPAYKDLVYALAHSHWALLKLHGATGFSHVKILSQGQRDDFAHTLAMYRLMGGVL